MNLINAFVNNPVKIAVGVLLSLLFGLIALVSMPIQLTPEVERPVISIQTRWPGASPQEVEREIVQEQEEQLKGVEGVTKMTSESMDSVATVSLEFGVGADLGAALLKVNSRLQQVPEYPEDANEPVITTSGAADSPIAWIVLRPRVVSAQELQVWADEHPQWREALAPALRARTSGLRHRRLEAAAAEHEALKELVPPDIDVPKLGRFAEDMIEARLERVSGVSNSNVIGGRVDELQIVVDPQRLAARRITIPQLRLALGVANRDVSAGDYWEGKRRYVVRTLGQFQTLEDVEGVVIARRDGVPVYVRDVAKVRRGFKKADREVQNFGRACIVVNCVRETGANVLDTMEGIKAAIVELNEGVLKDNGLQLDQVYDETEYIESAIGLVEQNIVIGGILTVLVLLIFLRSVRSTIVVSLAIPTSVIATFLLLGLMGRSLNVVSLAGMAFAVGMLVDNAIVVLENIYRRYQSGERRFDAAVRGTAEVWGAVVSSTLTTLAVFIPILFLEDEVGQLFGDIAIAISCAVGLSLIISVTVIPTATYRILRKRTDDHEREAIALADEVDVNAHVPRWLRPIVAPFDWLGKGFVNGVLAVHTWLQAGVLRQIVFCLVLVFGALLAAIPLIPEVEYLPTGNRNLAIAVILPPPGYNLDTMTAMGQELDRRLQPYWDPPAKLPDDPAYTEIEHYFYVAYGRQLFMGARSVDPLRAGQLVGILNGAVRGIPGTIAFAQQTSLFERGLTASRSVDIEIRGPDLERLVAIGTPIFMQVMGMYPGGQVRPIPSLDLSSPEVHVLPRWDRAADLGVTALDLGYTVNSFVDGAYAGDFFSGGDKIDITIVGESRYASRLQDLKDLPIATPTGNLVPLGSVAKVELSSGPEQINRRERERTITIQLSPPPDVPLEEAIRRVTDEVIEPLRQDGTIGGAYRITLGGTADKLGATWAELRWNLILAVLITYLLMAALFESWLYPFVVILSVPLGAVGGLAGLWVLNRYVDQPLDVLTMLGFVILVGTVVNNAILIVHQALNYMREDEMDTKDAVQKSIKTRIRPIYMTLFTTVFGLAPLVVFPGAGSELYRGIGSILIGGLFISTFFTLFLVPTLFRLLLGARRTLTRTVAR